MIRILLTCGPKVKLVKPLPVIEFLSPFSSSPKKIRKKMPGKLSEQERNDCLKPLLDAGWSLVEQRDAIKKNFTFKDFNKAFGFMKEVAVEADQMDHHPEWFNVYNKVDITLSSHDVNGLSQRDIKLANVIDKKAAEFKN